MLVQLGELSSARQALEGATLAPGNDAVKADFGQSNLGQSIFLCVVVVGFGVGYCSVLFVFYLLVLLCVCCLCIVLCCCCVFLCCCVLCLLFCCCCCVCVVGVFRASPPDPLHRTAQNFALFLPSPATVFILFSLSCWSSSLNFGGVFEDRDPQMCTFGLSGYRVKPRRPHQTGPPGLAHDSPRTPNVHI